jgi:hypothetical protein
MRLRRREQTITENMALFEANERRFRECNRTLFRLEWLMRWKRLKRWITGK